MINQDYDPPSELECLKAQVKSNEMFIAQQFRLLTAAREELERLRRVEAAAKLHLESWHNIGVIDDALVDALDNALAAGGDA